MPIDWINYTSNGLGHGSCDAKQQHDPTVQNPQGQSRRTCGHVATTSDHIIATIHDFIRKERKRNVSFLGRYNHCYKDPEELLMVEPANPRDAAALKRKTTNLENAGCFTFTEPIDRSHCTVAIRALDKENVKIQSMDIGMDITLYCRRA